MVSRSTWFYYIFQWTKIQDQAKVCLWGFEHLFLREAPKTIHQPCCCLLHSFPMTDGSFTWLVYSSYGITNELYMGLKISFVRNVFSGE